MLILVGILLLFGRPATASYAPLDPAADGLESHVQGIKDGMQQLKEALLNVPNKGNVTVLTDDTDEYIDKLEEQVRERRADLERESQHYYEVVGNSVKSLTESGSKNANSLFGKTNEAIQHRIKTAKIVLAQVKDELLKQIDAFRKDAKLVQDDQVNQATREIEVLIEALEFLQSNFKDKPIENIKKDFPVHIYINHIEKYKRQREKLQERYFYFPSDYLESSAFSLSWESASQLYRTLFTELPLQDSQNFLHGAKLGIQAALFSSLIPVLNETQAGFFHPDINYTHVLHQSLREKHQNISQMLDELDVDFFHDDRDLVKEHKIRFVELLHEMARARDRYRTLQPLLDYSNALALVLLVILLLFQLALLVGVAYRMTPQEDCRVYLQPPRPAVCFNPVY